MRCTRWAVKGVGVLAAVALLGAGFLGGCRGHRHGGPWAHTPADVQERADDLLTLLEKKIDATDDQKAKLSALKERLMPELLALQKSHEAAAKEVETLWLAPSLAPAALDALADKKVEEFRATERKLSQAAAELHALLTPEQRQKLWELHRRRCGH